jgi:RHS repeat-associated protein
VFLHKSYSHDLDGNVLDGAGCTVCTWSAEGRLASAGCGATWVYYRYDALGRLVRRARQVAGVWDSTTFIWDGAQLLAELNGTATRRISEYAYYPGIDRPLALLTGDTLVTQRRFFIQDGLGNVIGVLRDTLIDQKITYDPWGRQQQVTGTLPDSTNRLRWKGLLWDGVASAYYMRNRWYDPIGLEGGLNAYAFAFADPVSGSDPSGLDATASDTTAGGYQDCAAAGFQSHQHFKHIPNPNGGVGRVEVVWVDCSGWAAVVGAAMGGPPNGIAGGALSASGAWISLRDGLEYRTETDPHKGSHTHTRQHGRKFGEIIKNKTQIRPHGRGPQITNRVLRILMEAGLYVGQLRIAPLFCVGCTQWYHYQYRQLGIAPPPGA